MSASNWIAAVVPVVVVGGGVIYRAGQLTNAIKDLARRVTRIEERQDRLDRRR
jgi:hypothetical protein